jgi:predicted NAD-dependent protein-ADP-ribosyltransferase YbiA (DUF1768 family)
MDEETVRRIVREEIDKEQEKQSAKLKESLLKTMNDILLEQ